MDSWSEYGIQLITLLQIAAWLEVPMRFFTFLGTREFFVFVLPAIYWCVDAGLGIRIGLILLIGNGLNELAKMALHGPRPYWVSAQVKALVAEATFGAPSGHAQTAAGLWGTIAWGARRTWSWFAALIVIVMIGLSRLYLGVHFPQDVLLGWALGGLLLWMFLALWEWVAAWVRQRTLLQQVLLSLAAPAALLLGAGMLVNGLRLYMLPNAWMVNAARAGEPLPTPVSMDSTLTAAGTLLGLCLGLIWIHRRGGFKPSGPLWKRALCFLLGLIGLLIMYLGLKAAFPEGDSLVPWSLRFARYVLLGLWVAAGAPWVFMRLGLMQNKGRRRE